MMTQLLGTLFESCHGCLGQYLNDDMVARGIFE